MKKTLIQLFIVCITLVTNSLNCYAVTPYNEVQLGYGGWAESWFADDFGDPMYDQPYLITDLEQEQGRYSTRYFQICFAQFGQGPTFIISIGTRGIAPNKIAVDGDAIIKIKSADGQISTIEAPTYNGDIIITGENLVKFAELIDSGNYRLSLTFHSYLDIGGEPLNWTYNCTNETKDFWLAAASIFCY